MSSSLKTIACLFLAGLSQMALGSGNGFLVLCFGDDGHLAVEGSKLTCPYGLLDKHEHSNGSDYLSDRGDSSNTLETDCIDIPVSIDEDQRAFSIVDFKPPSLAEIEILEPLFSPPTIKQTAFRSKGVLTATDHLKARGTVVLLI